MKHTARHGRCVARWTFCSTPLLQTSGVHQSPAHRPLHVFVGNPRPLQIYSPRTVNSQSFAGSVDEHVAGSTLWLYLPCVVVAFQKLYKGVSELVVRVVKRHFLKRSGSLQSSIDSQTRFPASSGQKCSQREKHRFPKRLLARQERRPAVYRADTRRAVLPLPTLCRKQKNDFSVGGGKLPCIAPIHGEPRFHPQHFVASKQNDFVVYTGLTPCIASIHGEPLFHCQYCVPSTDTACVVQPVVSAGAGYMLVRKLFSEGC